MAKRRKKKIPNLAKLCHILTAEVSPEEFMKLCSELELNCAELQLDKPPIKLENVLLLVGNCYQQGLVDRLLAICNDIQAGITRRIMSYEVYTEWIPEGTVTEGVIQKVNEALGIIGRPYMISSEPAQDTNWQSLSQETGCYCWAFEPIPIDPTWESQPYWSQLQQVRTIIAGEPYFAYLTRIREWGEWGMGGDDCLVIAPTRDQFDAIRIEQASENDVGPEALLREFGWLNEEYGVNLIAVYDGRIEFQLKRPPQDRALLEFSKWFQDFAPDAFRERFGDDDSVTQDTVNEHIALWWS